MTICIYCAKEFAPSGYWRMAAVSKNIRIPACDSLCSQECIDLYVEGLNKKIAESGWFGVQGV